MRVRHLAGRDQEVAPTEERSLQQTVTVESLNERVFFRIGITALYIESCTKWGKANIMLHEKEQLFYCFFVWV